MGFASISTKVVVYLDPEDFMFHLTESEWNVMWSQIVTTSSEESNAKNLQKVDDQLDDQLEEDVLNRSQFVTGSLRHRNKTFLPYAFTEHGVTMLSSVLRSERAISMKNKNYFISQFQLNHELITRANNLY